MDLPCADHVSLLSKLTMIIRFQVYRDPCLLKCILKQVLSNRNWGCLWWVFINKLLCCADGQEKLVGTYFALMKGLKNEYCLLHSYIYQRGVFQMVFFTESKCCSGLSFNSSKPGDDKKRLQEAWYRLRLRSRSNTWPKPPFNPVSAPEEPIGVW